MSFFNPEQPERMLMNNILHIIVNERRGLIESFKEVTLRDIYGVPFSEQLTIPEKRRLGMRFKNISEGLGFVFTGLKRSKANIYIKFI